MPTQRPVLLLLAAPPEDAGAGLLIERAAERARSGQAVAVLLSHAGLAFADDPRLRELSGVDGVTVTVCSANARDGGWTLDTTPPFVAWSALISWLRGTDPSWPLWVAL